jgi:hypothetical protein
MYQVRELPNPDASTASTGVRDTPQLSLQTHLMTKSQKILDLPV